MVHQKIYKIESGSTFVYKVCVQLHQFVLRPFDIRTLLRDCICRHSNPPAMWLIFCVSKGADDWLPLHAVCRDSNRNIVSLVAEPLIKDSEHMDGLVHRRLPKFWSRSPNPTRKQSVETNLSCQEPFGSFCKHFLLQSLYRQNQSGD